MRLIFFTLFLISQNLFALGIENKTIEPGEKKLSPLIKDELKPFTSDGCTKYPNGTDETPDLWLDCCIEHDSKYWLGGTEQQKLEADTQFRECIREKSKQDWRANIMYWAVRVFGGPERNTDYRWGYGWTRLHYFKALSEDELRTAHAMYGSNLGVINDLVKNRQAFVGTQKNHSYNVPLDYNFCEEQVLVYLKKHLTTKATIQKVRIWEPKWDPDSQEYHLLVSLDICNGSLDFLFDKQTDQYSCGHDYYYAKDTNKIIQLRVPQNCKEKFLEEK